MAKKIIIPEPPAEFREQYAPGYACFPLKWRERIATLPDEVAGRLLVAVLEHCECGRTTPPEGLDAFSFGFILDAVDEYQERGLQSEWKKKYLAQLAARERWNDKGEGAEMRTDADGCGRKQTNAAKCHNINNTSTSNLESTLNSNPTKTVQDAQARGMVGNGGEWPEVNLSDYLTPEEEERLFEGAANYETGFLERFVLSSYYCREDSLYQKTEKALKFRDEEHARYYAEKEAAEKEREAAEDAKSVKEIKEELKAKARTLSGYSNGQRPRDLEELQNFCKDLGCPDFPAVLLWSEMEFHGWEIHEGDTWRAVKSWKGLVIHRIAVEKCEG